MEVRKSWFVAVTLDDSAAWVAIKPQRPQVTNLCKGWRPERRDPKYAFSVASSEIKGVFFFYRLLISASAVTNYHDGDQVSGCLILTVRNGASNQQFPLGLFSRFLQLQCPAVLKIVVVVVEVFTITQRRRSMPLCVGNVLAFNHHLCVLFWHRFCLPMEYLF